MAEGNFSNIEQQISDMVAKLDQMESRGVIQSLSASGGKGWQLTRPKDMEPSEFTGEDEEWLEWKDTMEDYVDAVHPGLKQALHLAAKASSQLDARIQLNTTEQEWNLSCNLFVLLKRKTAGEARSLATCVDRENGDETWRILIGRFEPQVGIRRMKEVADLMALQNK